MNNYASLNVSWTSRPFRKLFQRFEAAIPKNDPQVSPVLHSHKWRQLPWLYNALHQPLRQVLHRLSAMLTICEHTADIRMSVPQ